MVPDAFYTIQTVITISSLHVVAALSHIFPFIQNPMAAPANQSGFLANRRHPTPGPLSSVERVGENALLHANLVFKYGGAKKAELTKVKWCKCKKMPEHEFLLIHVRETVSPNRTAIVMVERLFNPQAVQQDTNRQGGSSITTPTDTSNENAAASSGTTIAHDIVALSYTADESSVTERQHDSWSAWESMDVSTHGISLMQLADVVEAVHRYHPNYSMTYQCYFFARATFNALRSLAGMELWKPSGRKWQRVQGAGRLNGISVPEDDFAVANQQIMKIYEDIREEFPSDSCLSPIEERQGRVQAEQCLAEERQGRVEERVQAEERLAEERVQAEERLAEERRRRIEERVQAEERLAEERAQAAKRFAELQGLLNRLTTAPDHPV